MKWLTNGENMLHMRKQIKNESSYLENISNCETNKDKVVEERVNGMYKVYYQYKEKGTKSSKFSK